jgi:hypothetical protein
MYPPGGTVFINILEGRDLTPMGTYRTLWGQRRTTNLEGKMRYVFGIGTGYRGDGSIIPENQRVIYTRQTLELVTKVFGGCFIVQGHGAWQDGDNLIVESGLQVIADTPADGSTLEQWQGKATALAAELARLWDQTAVHLSALVSRSNLVYGAYQQPESVRVGRAGTLAAV